MTRDLKRNLLLATAGFLFALGLTISGMTQPAKVIGFLDAFGIWDPSLALVMLGAVAVYLIVHRKWVAKPVGAVRSGGSPPRPFFADRFDLPTRSDIDAPLLAGTAIFGVGWGLSGFCPGPALVSLGAATSSALWFVPAAIVGMWAHHRLSRSFRGTDG